MQLRSWCDCLQDVAALNDELENKEDRCPTGPFSSHDIKLQASAEASSFSNKIQRVDQDANMVGSRLWHQSQGSITASCSCTDWTSDRTYLLPFI